MPVASATYLWKQHDEDAELLKHVARTLRPLCEKVDNFQRVRLAGQTHTSAIVTPTQAAVPEPNLRQLSLCNNGPV